MMGIFFDGKRSTDYVVVWEGGTGFKIRSFGLSLEGDGVVLKRENLNLKDLSMRKKVTPDNVQAHVDKLFDMLAKGEIELKEVNW
jgi:hypothetical protein